MLLSFSSSIYKFIPESLVNYFINNKINSLDWLNIFVTFVSITGVTTIWRFFYIRYYIGKTLEIDRKNSYINKKPFKMPKFHMLSIHNFFSDATTIFVLVYLLILNAGTITIQPTLNYIFNLLRTEYFIIPFFFIGILSTALGCISLVIGFLGTATNRAEDLEEN